MTSFIYVPVLVYLVILGFIVTRVIKNNEALTAQQFLKGASNYPWLILSITLVATFIGPGFSLGTIDSTHNMGWTFGLAVACTPLHMLVTGVFLLKSDRANKITSYRTAGGLIEDTFGKIARPLLGLWIVVLYTLFSAQLITGSVVILEVVYGFSGETVAILIAIVVATYSLSCGISGVVKTDVLQFVFLGILLLFFVFLGSKISGVEVPADLLNSKPSGTSFNFAIFLGIALVFLFGDAFQPLYMQRAFFGKSAKDAGVAFLIGGLFAISWFILLAWVGISISDKTILFSNDQGIVVEALGFVVDKNSIGYALILGVIGAGFVGLIMSTLDSVLNTASGTLVDDLLPVFAKNIDERNNVVLMKMSVAVIAILGAMIAAFHENMIELMLQAYEVWIPTMLAIVIVAFFRVGMKTRISNAAVLLAMVVGVGIWSLGLWCEDRVLPWAVWGFLGNLLVLLVGIALGKRGIASDSAAEIS